MSTRPHPEPPFILTLDIGTSSTRAMLFDRWAKPVGDVLAQVPNQLQTTADGGAEFDPAALFDGVTRAIDQALSQAGPLADAIGGVGIDTFVTNFMGLDSAGRPLTPIYTFADRRCAADAEALRQEFDLEAVHNRTGCRIHSAYLPARFRWLARTQPEVLQTVAHWLSIGEYLFWQFFGERVVSYSVASWSGLLDRHTLAWDEVWLADLPVKIEQFSKVTDVDQPRQGLKPAWAERWPALKSVPWFPAIGDGAAANVGSGCTTPERLALTIGTTGAMRTLVDRSPDTVPAGLWLYRLNRRYGLLGGATTEGGNVFAWLNQTLKLPPDLEATLANMPPAGHGLTFLPFLAGERAPGWQDDARASLINFTLDTQPVDILRAGLEGVAYRFALIHRQMQPHLPPDHQIIASGSGLLNSPAWMQIMADVLNRPLTASAEPEATSRGVALMALDALGLTDEKPISLGATYLPRSDYHTQYQIALETQIDLYHRLIQS
ncbi:MAG: gluconokinase [Anaerolineae bacterium]|nr:gluconokinase [Anaerolineae bacterium]